MTRPSHEDQTGSVTQSSFLIWTAMPSWLTSSIVHAIVILVLALLTVPMPASRRPENVLVLTKSADEATDLVEFRAEEITDEEMVTDELTDRSDLVSDMVVSDSSSISSTMVESAPPQVELDPLGITSMLASDATADSSGSTPNALQGRSAAGKKQLLTQAGGTPGSEAAVANGLKWLAAHQFPDGSWRLEHHASPQCNGTCRHPGSRKDAPFGATALALLPFLGAGHTHLEGDYRQVVERGLAYLIANMRVAGDRASLTDSGGNYYSHGMSTIVMCESLALTKDPRFAVPAQWLVNEIAAAQEPIGGGWRYKAGQVGDTSVFGWQMMALKSAHLAGVRVPPITIHRAAHFLDTVADDDGYKYRYLFNPKSFDNQPPVDSTRLIFRRSTSSVGLLCRMYMGWTHEDPRIQQGVDYLGRLGPSVAGGKPEIYYDYHATQVMRHYGGEPWEKWNSQMRDALIALQSTSKHESGSWYFDVENQSSHKAGGRLYCTALSTLILEVYYRHLPLYQGTASETEFPL